MVGDASLRKIVGADALGAIARADQRFARGGLLGVLRLNLCVANARHQDSHGFFFVAVLAAVVLAFDHSAGRDVGDAHGGVGFVDVLTACAGRAEGVNA